MSKNKTTKLMFEAVEIANYGKIDCCFKPMDDKATALMTWYKDHKYKGDKKFKVDRATLTKTMMVELANLCSQGGKDVDFIIGKVKPLERSHQYDVGSKVITAVAPSFDDSDIPL